LTSTATRTAGDCIGSAVFKVESLYTNEYIREMRPRVHYIPISSDLNDLVIVTAIIKSDNVSSLETIARNARSLANRFNYSSEKKRVRNELNNYLN
jgi:hypothetical protein